MKKTPELTPSNPQISVIIGTFNSRELLKNNIKALMSQKIDLEIIIVDDGSTDGTSEFLRKCFPQVKLIQKQTNEGFAKAVNLGAKYARGNYLFIENADMEVDKNYLSILSRFLDMTPSIAAVQGTIFDCEHRNIPITVGLLLHRGGTIISLLNLYGVPKKPHYILSGDALLVRKTLFEKLGGYDSNYRLYFEDVDFGWRLWFTGHRIMNIPQAKMYHKGGGSTRKMHASYVYSQVIRNSLLANIKYMESTNLIRAILVRALLSFYAVIMFFKKRQWSYIGALLLAWGSILRDSKNILTLRFETQKIRQVSDNELFSHIGASINWKYIKNAFSLMK